jgi:hypothetical protein
VSMEITCHRCHQSVPTQSCFCPNCGLPQLVYTADSTNAPVQPENGTEAARDASSIDWKPGMRAAIALAVPAGLLSSGISPLSWLGLVWMGAAAVWAVRLYMRSQRPAWITIGAGARLGLVTGILAAWLAFAVSGTVFFVQRVVYHHASAIDSEWKDRVEKSEQMTQQWATQMGVADAGQVAAQRNWMLSPEGHAGFQAFGMITSCLFLVLFATAGGAIGARVVGRRRRPEI